LSLSADQLKTSEYGIIKGFDDENYMGRFLSLGIEPGAKLTVVRIAMFNGARIVSIDGHKFAMRKSELKMIQLQ